MERVTRKEALTLLELIDASRRCAGVDEIKALMTTVGDFLSFEMAVCGLAQADAAGALTSQQIVNISYPAEWLSLYSEGGFAKVDPVVRCHMTDLSPKLWSDCYNRFGRPQPFVSLAEDFGVRNGCSFGAVSPNDRTVSIFSFSTKNDPPRRVLQLFDIISPHFHEALRRALHPFPACRPAALSQREMEVLRWIANGKNSWEISVILGISERTVKFHTSAILDKLEASNRAHAVAKAISLQLICLD